MARVDGEFSPPFDVQKALSFDSEHLLRSENLPFDIDNWYPSLSRWTFETKFVPLSRAEARAIIRYYRVRFLGGRQSAKVDHVDVSALRGLENRIDGIIKAHFSGCGCFMRLCGRSAKDAEPRDRHRVRREYEAALREVMQNTGTVNLKGCAADCARGRRHVDSSVKMRAAARVQVLRCESGADVMSLLLSSERVYSDLLDWLWFGEPEQVVLRRWEPEVSLDYEFRLYVHGGSLNAISQYDHYCRYDHLFLHRETLRERLRAFWREIHPNVGPASYAMDVAVLPQSGRLVLVELSPFLRCTGAHCFRWQRDEDVAVLEGQRPFEFRLVIENPQGFDDMFARGWEQRWYSDDDDFPPYWRLYESRSARVARRFQRFGGTLFCCWADITQSCVSSDVSKAAAAAKCAALVSAGKVDADTGDCSELPSTMPACPPKVMARESKWTLLFLYGTLKRGMHWNSKFLSTGAVFLSKARSVGTFPLVVGRCGVPYLLFDQYGSGHRVRGEIWAVDADTLEGLDDYEGLTKGYYVRQPLVVQEEACPFRHLTVEVYAVRSSSEALRRLQPLEEYTLEWHRQNYRAVEHIILKQRLHLQGAPEYSCKHRRHPSCSIDDDAVGGCLRPITCDVATD
eukprot:TRINITY_DN4593_c0_g1_i1.p1 TRINITY_DN4593_c0_g1~~TRINITY_DN4593_c0_g1_i1.p1  ORF type:complete len:637 (+),score=90.33 TRINITY_DN4593_c0_g1_i1:31-1911(+)